MFKPENNNSKNFSSANIEELLLKAKNGDAIASHDLGLAYEDGDYVAQDLSQALTWYRRSADSGNADSKFRLGRIFQFGLNGEVDCQEAVKWYQQAIADGHLLAKVSLGRMYVAGEGVEQNYKVAESLFREAGLEGDRDAQNNLGCIYLGGLGTELDEVEAAKWFELSAGQGNQKAQLSLGLMYRDGMGVSQSYELAYKWLYASAIQGDDGAQFHLGHMLMSGEGVPEDPEQGYQWLKSSADQGNELAIETIAILDGEGDLEEKPFEPFSFTQSPMVEIQNNGTRSIWITVEELQWSASSNVILGGMMCEREELESPTNTLSDSAVISHGFYEILKSRGVPEEEATSPDARLVAGDIVTIDWRVQAHPNQSHSGLWRMTYQAKPDGLGYSYLGGFTDYYYGEDEMTKDRVKSAKIKLVEESNMDVDLKTFYRGVIETDFNEQISVS